VKVVDFVLARPELLQDCHVFTCAPYCVDWYIELVLLAEKLWELGKWETLSEEAILDGLLRARTGDICLCCLW
jgi:hypothetical protein